MPQRSFTWKNVRHLVVLLLLTTASPAAAQYESRYASPFLTGYRSSPLEQKLSSIDDSDKLLEQLDEMIRNDQLGTFNALGGNLPLTTMSIGGWRWEAPTSKRGRVVLAIDGPLAIAIYESPQSAIEMSIRDYSAVSKEQPRLLGERHLKSQSTAHDQHFSAMSAKQFSRTAPEIFKVYYYYAGPTRTIPNSRSLPRPTWLPAWSR